MNWFKENPFLAGLAAVAVIVGGALGYMVFQSWSEYALASESYTAAVTKLHSLQNKVPFPSDANLKTVQSGLDDYAARISRLRSQLAKMEIALDTTITPQQFQDGLRTAVNELREKAAANHVRLPENFYFGFDQYQTQVPNEAAAPYLNRQLVVLKTILNRLVDLKVQSIDALHRQPLIQENPSQPAPAGKGQPAPEKVLEKAPFEITFTAEQSKFRVAFNSLLASDQFLLIRAVGLVNSAPQAPARGGESPVPPPANPLLGGSAATGKNLQVIFGRESVQATLRIEILDFTEPPATKN